VLFLGVFRRLRHCLSDNAQLACRFPRSCLEAIDDVAQMAVYLFVHEEDAVDVVGHDAELHRFYLWVVLLNGEPALLHALAKGRQHHMGGLAALPDVNIADVALPDVGISSQTM